MYKLDGRREQWNSERRQECGLLLIEKTLVLCFCDTCNDTNSNNVKFTREHVAAQVVHRTAFLEPSFDPFEEGGGGFAIVRL